MIDSQYEILAEEAWNAAENKGERLNLLQTEFNRMIGQAQTTCMLAQQAEAKFSSWRACWKIILIIITGLIAVINLVGASYPDIYCLPLISAIMAIFLTTFGNLDSFLDYTRRLKENGDLFRNLRDISFRYQCLYLLHVRSMGHTYAAYKNAILINLDLCQAIAQARGRFKEQKYKEKPDPEKDEKADKV